MLMINPIRRDALLGRLAGNGKFDQTTSKIVSLLYLVFLYTISTRINAGVYEKSIYISISFMLDYIYTKMKMDKSNEKYPSTTAWQLVDQRFPEDCFYYIIYLILPICYSILSSSFISMFSSFSMVCFTWVAYLQPLSIISLGAVTLALNVYYFTYVR
jgi:hypothetical protein